MPQNRWWATRSVTWGSPPSIPPPLYFASSLHSPMPAPAMSGKTMWEGCCASVKPCRFEISQEFEKYISHPFVNRTPEIGSPDLIQHTFFWSRWNFLCVFFSSFPGIYRCFLKFCKNAKKLPSLLSYGLDSRNWFPRYLTYFHSSDHDDTCYVSSSRPSP